MDVREERLELADIEARALRFVDAEVAPFDLPAEGEPLEVEESRCALEVREPHRIKTPQPFELRAARDPPAQHVDEVGIVLLEHPEESGDVAADVVDRLDARPEPAPQEYPAHAHEGLGIAVMVDGLNDRADPLREVALAADVPGSGTHRHDCLHCCICHENSSLYPRPLRGCGAASLASCVVTSALSSVRRAGTPATPARAGQEK